MAEVVYKVTNDKNVNNIKKVGRNRIIVECSEAITANTIVENDEIGKKFNVYIPIFLISREVIVKNIDFDYEEEILKSVIDNRQYKIKDVMRMKRRVIKDGETELVPTNSIKISFFGQSISEYIYIWNARFPCEPYVRVTRQCFRCLRFGHITKQCKSTLEKCIACGENGHTKANCTANKLICFNCKEEHEATSRNCPERDQQNNIHRIMANHNMSYQEAALEIPKIITKTDQITVTTNNRFALLSNYEEDFPELQETSTQKIPTYVPPPISKYRNKTANRKDMYAHALHSSQNRNKRERHSSTEREEDEKRNRNINKKIREEDKIETRAIVHKNNEDDNNMDAEDQQNENSECDIIDNQNMEEIIIDNTEQLVKPQ